MGKWLRTLGNLTGDSSIGRHIEIFWPSDNIFYGGTVAAYKGETGEHEVYYDDGGKEVLQLSMQTVRWGPVPQPGAREKVEAEVAAVAQAAAAAGGGEGRKGSKRKGGGGGGGSGGGGGGGGGGGRDGSGGVTGSHAAGTASDGAASVTVGAARVGAGVPSAIGAVAAAAAAAPVGTATAGAARAVVPKPPARVPGGVAPTDEWIACDACHRWRRVPEAVAAALGEDDTWHCAENPDTNFASCAVEEEPYTT
jgi:hypothetical protein